MVEIREASLGSPSNKAADGPPSGSQQGQNRTEVIQQISEVSKDPFQALTLQNKALREFGGSKNPLDVIVTGGKETNSAESTKAPVIPEIGKGSIADVVL
ncbi:hypothetical protein UR09_04725 [Candidatus Nitromaritima sp. SCGC AAA799-A02]|nr:hypothetical protein UR09_04725 [Candidatus Nitromaritima sp. SCGC AAA799-A02]KMP12453.1 hypothetical protein UZ36_00930 [Candidatus Nitromaritima sp. SCGC AAA799-C22]